MSTRTLLGSIVISCVLSIFAAVAITRLFPAQSFPAPLAGVGPYQILDQRSTGYCDGGTGMLSIGANVAPTCGPVGTNSPAGYQSGSMPLNPPAAASFTVTGNMALTDVSDQHVHGLRATMNASAQASQAAASVAQTFPGSGIWSINMAFRSIFPAFQYPAIGVAACTSATGTCSVIAHFGNNGTSSNCLHVTRATAGGSRSAGAFNEVCSVFDDFNGLGDVMYLRIMGDGTNAHYQTSRDGYFWLDWYVEALSNLGSLTTYGFAQGNDFAGGGQGWSSTFVYELAFTIPASGTITNVTKANPAVVTESTNHGLIDGDMVAIHGVVGSTNVNNSTWNNWVGNAVNGAGSYFVHVLSPTTYSLPGIDTSAQTNYVSGGTRVTTGRF